MNKTSTKQAKAKHINSKTNLRIVHYLNQSGNIVGHKVTNTKNFILIIEFSDYNRIWMLPEELEDFSNNNFVRMTKQNINN
nr:cytochrome b6-f complex subunit PetP [Gloiopeltis furcata]